MSTERICVALATLLCAVLTGCTQEEAADPSEPARIGRVLDIAFSPDGTEFVSVGDDNVVRFWDPRSGAPLSDALEGHRDKIFVTAFAPGGRTLATGSLDGSVRLWDVEKHRGIGGPLTHQRGVLSVAFANDDLLLSGGYDGKIWMWDGGTGASRGIWSDIGASVKALTVSPDRRHLAAVDQEGRLWLWRLDTNDRSGVALRVARVPLFDVVFDQRSERVFVGDREGRLCAWDLATQEEQRCVQAHAGVLQNLEFDYRSDQLISAGRDGAVRFWSLELEAVRSPLTQHSSRVNGVAIDPTGELLATGSFDHTVVFWDRASGKVVRSVGEPVSGELMAVAASPDEQLLAIGSSKGAIRLWSNATREFLEPALPGHSGGTRAVAFSPDGTLLASGGVDSAIRFWDVRSLQPVGKPRFGHSDKIHGVAFTNGAAELVSIGWDGTLRLWDMQNSEAPSVVLADVQVAIRGLTQTPDGQYFIVSDTNGRITIVDKEARKIVKAYNGHDTAVPALQFDAAHQRFLSVSYDWTLRTWDWPSGDPIGEPQKLHRGLVRTLVLSRDGTLAASGDYAGNLVIWDIGQDVAPRFPLLTGHTGPIQSVAIFGSRNDGATVVSVGEDSIVRLWDAHTGALMQSVPFPRDAATDASRSAVDGSGGGRGAGSGAGGGEGRRRGSGDGSGGGRSDSERSAPR